MSSILIADDDKNLRQLYSEELKDEGYDARTAATGKEAVDLVKEERPDLVVLDISMPGMDGIEVLAKILAYDKTIPIIINTAYSAFKDNFMTWSADAYVVKSGDLTELKEKIGEVLSAKVPAK